MVCKMKASCFNSRSKLFDKFAHSFAHQGTATAYKGPILAGPDHSGNIQVNWRTGRNIPESKKYFCRRLIENSLPHDSNQSRCFKNQ